MEKSDDRQAEASPSMLDAARLYIENGFSVIPINRGSKMPDGQALARGQHEKRWGGGWRKYVHQPAREAELQSWFGPCSTSFLAIVTGYRGLAAIDFDDMNRFRKWKAEHPEIAERAPLQLTRKGVHLFLRCRKLPSTRFWPHELVRSGETDLLVGSFKGREDYVVAWPSGHISGGFYQWAKGRAPWECELPEIGDFREIGLELAISRWRLVVNAFAGIALHPLQTLQCLRYYRHLLVGRRNHHTQQLKPREYWARLKIASLRNEKSRKRNWVLEDEGPGRS